MEIIKIIRNSASASKSTWASSLRSLVLWWTHTKPHEIRSPWQEWKGWERGTFEVLFPGVSLVCFDHEWQCPNPCPLCWRVQRSGSMTSDTQQIRSRHTESSCSDGERHDACETLVWPRWGFWLRLESQRAWMSENGNVRQELFWRMQLITRWWWIFLVNNLQLGTYANSAALRTALLQWCFFPKLWSESDRVSWKWSRCGWWQQDASRLSQERQGEGQRQTPKPKKEISQATQATHATQTTRAIQTTTRARIVAGTLGERLLQTRWRSLRQQHQ